MTTIIEVSFQPVTDLKPVVGRNRNVSKIKQPMNICAK